MLTCKCMSSFRGKRTRSLVCDGESHTSIPFFPIYTCIHTVCACGGRHWSLHPRYRYHTKVNVAVVARLWLSSPESGAMVVLFVWGKGGTCARETRGDTGCCVQHTTQTVPSHAFKGKSRECTHTNPQHMDIHIDVHVYTYPCCCCCPHSCRHLAKMEAVWREACLCLWGRVGIVRL